MTVDLMIGPKPTEALSEAVFVDDPDALVESAMCSCKVYTKDYDEHIAEMVEQREHAIAWRNEMVARIEEAKHRGERSNR